MPKKQINFENAVFFVTTNKQNKVVSFEFKGVPDETINSGEQLILNRMQECGLQADKQEILEFLKNPDKTEIFLK